MQDNQLDERQRNTATAGERGQAIVMVSLGILFLMGILGLVIDVGWGYYRKQVAQAAADAAATAAVVAAGTGTITCGSGGVVCQAATACTSATAGTNIKAGCQYGAYDGIANANMTMAANVTTPISGVAVKYWVTATVAEPMLPTFLRVIGFNSATVGAQATGAVIAGGGGNAGGCLYVMDPSSGQALYLNGANLTVTCGVYINSSNTTNAFQLNSAAATLNTGTNGLTMVTGGKINCSGCGCKTDAYYGTQNPSNTTQCTDPSYAPAATDPLASIPAPTYSGCNQTNYSWSNLSPAQTLNPGVYCGGINIGGGNVTFNPGTYVLNGGGLKIQGSNTTVSGTGVFFYNTSSGYTAGSLLVSGQPALNFTAPSSGPYEGVWFMQDHSVCPSTSHAFQGNSNVKTNGTIYIHCTQTGGGYVAQNILYTGQSASGYYSALVVDTIQINGMSNLVLDPTGGQNTGIGLGSANKPFLIQ
jgi:Flp pilus assembly protein TadG